MKKRVYLDFAATTPLDLRVLKSMLPFLKKIYGNPSSIHSEGLVAKKALDLARKSVARNMEAHVDEVVFTSGGTESNNLAILGVAKNLEERGVHFTDMHFITTPIEHSSVLECFEYLKEKGAKVSYCDVKESGEVDLKSFESLICKNTVLVSIGYANNEIGTIQPLRKISGIIKNFSEKNKTNIIFHTDASQAPVYLDCVPSHLGVDLLTIDGHKMYGPKGVGVLYVKRNTKISPILLGGGQEMGLRSTTENLPLLVGLATAFDIATVQRAKDSEKVLALRNYLWAEIEKNLSKFKPILNGSLEKRLPNNLNISFVGVNTEFLLLKLDANGVACSTKSSCLGSSGGSYVVRAISKSEPRALSTLRFTLGRETTKKDLNFAVKQLIEVLS